MSSNLYVIRSVPMMMSARLVESAHTHMVQQAAVRFLWRATSGQASRSAGRESIQGLPLSLRPADIWPEPRGTIAQRLASGLTCGPAEVAAGTGGAACAEPRERRAESRPLAYVWRARQLEADNK